MTSKNNIFVSLAVTLLLLAPALSSAQERNAEIQSHIAVLFQQVIALLEQISALQAAEAAHLESDMASPAIPPGVTTAGCVRMTNTQTTSGLNSCGDLYCPNKASPQRYWCRAGKNAASWYSSAYPCTGLSCSI